MKTPTRFLNAEGFTLPTSSLLICFHAEEICRDYTRAEGLRWYSSAGRPTANQLFTEDLLMMKQILVSCALLGLLTVGSLPAYAQTPAPAPTTPAATQNISPDELKKFASAIKQMLAIAQETDTKMAQAVQQSGLSEVRFREIYVSKKDPAAKPKEPVSPKEEETYNQTIAKLTQLQKDAKTKMDKSIVAEGLAVDRFNQIFGVVQKDPKLQQEVRDMIKK